MHSIVHPTVAEALAASRPVVALESTIIAHGLPYPANLEIAHALEDAVRAGGAVPATIAVVDGVARIGLGPDVIERVAADGARFAKAGAIDLAVHAANATNAATTVSATALLAARAGIQVFATGGIGGVHRGDHGDVSLDLTTLARTPIAVISAGAKAILDLPRTLELLETLGVLVLGYRTDDFPGFYTATTGLRLEHRVDDVARIAQICRTRWHELGQAGVLVCNPIPPDAALDRRVIDDAVAEALAAAATAGVRGKALTPFLLARIAVVTDGAAVRANRALALDNAQLGAALAVALTTSQRPAAAQQLPESADRGT